ncbi:unnamed protein product [Tilletia controversa]|nr:unnamed protein product [Tilletia controversa]
MSSGPPIQSISIPRSEARNTPSPPHQVYAITIALPVRSWTIYRRYSDFLTLHTTLLQLVPECPPPAPFPPKHAAKHAFRACVHIYIYNSGEDAFGGGYEARGEDRRSGGGAA